jgi:hypothetical protein
VTQKRDTSNDLGVIAHHGYEGILSKVFAASVTSARIARSAAKANAAVFIGKASSSERCQGHMLSSKKRRHQAERSLYASWSTAIPLETIGEIRVIRG